MIKLLSFIIFLVLIFSGCRSANIIEAINRDRVDDVKYFLSKGDSINGKTKDGDQYIFYIIKNGTSNMLKFAIDQKIDLKVVDKFGNNPLLFSIFQKKGDMVTILSKYIDINSFNSLGQTPLRVSVDNGNYKLFKYLIKNGAKIDKSLPLEDETGKLLLFYATKGGNLDIIKYLIEKKSLSLKIKDSNGHNLMIAAASQKNIEVINYLEMKGLSVKYRSNDGWTPLMEAAQNGNLDIVMFLIGNGANIDAKSDYNWTPLMSSVIGKNIEITKYLLEMGANYKIKNNSGKTALDIAIEKKYEKMSEILLQKEGEELGNILLKNNYFAVK